MSGSRLIEALKDRAVDLVSEIVGKPLNRRLSSRREARWESKGSLGLVLAGKKRGV